VFSGGFDGIVGLAYPKMAESGVEPFFDAIMREKVLENNIFAFYMSMNPMEDDSELTFGFYDDKRFKAETLKWHPVADKLFWSLRLDDIKVNGVPLNICKDKVCLVTPDTGTSMSTMPSWAFKIFEEKTYTNPLSCEEAFVY